jgi:hypothetical protein
MLAPPGKHQCCPSAPQEQASSHIPGETVATCRKDVTTFFHIDLGKLYSRPAMCIERHRRLLGLQEEASNRAGGKALAEFTMHE